MSLAACSSNDTDRLPLEETERMALQVKAYIASTRATATAFEAGDEIGVYAVSTAKDGLTEGTNVKYVAQQNTVDFTSSTPIYFMDKNAVNVSAYYPYTDRLTDNVMTVEAGTDHQTDLGQKAIDLLYATGTASVADKAGIQMSFEHLMAKLTFSFVAGSGIDDENLEKLGSTFKVEGLKVNGTFDTLNGTLDTTNDTETVLQPSTTVKTILVFPQTPSALRVTLTYDGINYVANTTVPEGGFKKGTNYAYTLKLNRSELTVSTSEIIDWTISDQGEVNAEYVSESE
jgi:hypothetical protein